MEKYEKDLVTIIIPVYNASRFLKETITTLLNQTYSNFEALFVNDCSLDDSAEIILDCKDERIKLVNNKINSGAAISRNNGVKIAKGKYICFIDADDLWEKDKLEKQVRFMREKKCAFSFTGYEFTDEIGKPNGVKVSIPEIWIK